MRSESTSALKEMVFITDRMKIKGSILIRVIFTWGKGECRESPG